MNTRTKVICTLGPSLDSYEKICAMIQEGMDVARINFSHGDYEKHKQRMDWVKQARKELNKPVAIMLDTKGPEIRVDKIPGDVIELEAGQKVTLKKEVKQESNTISIHPIEVLDTVSVGMKILFNDGYITSKVIQKKGREVVVEIQNAGILAVRKGVNIPNTSLKLPALTEEDKKDLAFGCEQDIDIVAASFIRSADHILSIKEILTQHGKPEVLIIAKIENSEGIENFDSIVQVADGVMVARGDLGVELDLGEIPKLQKMMIRRCYEAHKPVVTATQMLESMIFNPRPTRAEVSDVANAIYDSTSAVMLSGETAIGKYPLETLKTMKGIIYKTEEDFSYRDFFESHSKKGDKNVSSAVALAAVQTAYTTESKAIFAFTSSGFTARLVSRLRPEQPIIAVTTKEKNYHQLAINWGVIPIHSDQLHSVKEAFSFAEEFAREKGFISFGDLVVVTAGSPFGITGSTNTLLVQSIGAVISRGFKGQGKQVEGEVTVYVSSSGKASAKDKILVIAKCDTSFLPLMKQAKGVILDNHREDTVSEKYALLVASTYDIPIIVRAEGSLSLLREGESITMDPPKALIYRTS